MIPSRALLPQRPCVPVRQDQGTLSNLKPLQLLFPGPVPSLLASARLSLRSQRHSFPARTQHTFTPRTGPSGRYRAESSLEPPPPHVPDSLWSPMGRWGQHHLVEAPMKATGEPWAAQPHLPSRRWRPEAWRGGAGVSLMPQEEPGLRQTLRRPLPKPEGSGVKGSVGQEPRAHTLEGTGRGDARLGPEAA